MTDNDFVAQLASLLREQMRLSDEIQKLSGDQEDKARHRLSEITNDGFTMMERYFRQILYPMLKAKFPNKLAHSDIADGQQVLAFTELLQDFFIEIRNRHDDDQWVTQSPIVLRNLAARVIQNDILDAIRKRKRRLELDEEYGFIKAISDDTEKLLAQQELALEPVMLILEHWDSGKSGSGNWEEKKTTRACDTYEIYSRIHDG